MSRIKANQLSNPVNVVGIKRTNSAVFDKWVHYLSAERSDSRGDCEKKRIRIIYVHLYGAICTNLMDICKTGASCLDLKREICLEDKNTAVQHWWDVNGVVTAAGLERGQWDVRAAGGQGLLGMRDTHEDSYTHRRTQRLNVNIWTSLQSCCASDPLEHLKENLFPACLSDTGRAEETDPEMYCTNMHVTINPMLTFVTFDFSYNVNSARIIPPPRERTIIFWTATGDKLCWALWVKSFIVVIFIVVSQTQVKSEVPSRLVHKSFGFTFIWRHAVCQCQSTKTCCLPVDNING